MLLVRGVTATYEPQPTSVNRRTAKGVRTRFAAMQTGVFLAAACQLIPTRNNGVVATCGRSLQRRSTAESAQPAHAAHHLHQAAAFHLLHHRAHLLELIEQAVD